MVVSDSRPKKDNVNNGDIMSGETAIRSAKTGDFEEIITLFESWAPHDWDKEFARKYFDHYFNDKRRESHDKVFVKIVSGKIVGVIGYVPDTYGTPGVFWLGWFYVQREEVGAGHGRDLLGYVIDKLRDAKARKLYLDTSTDELYLPARSLYESMGFGEEATLNGYYGKGEAQLIYCLNLSAR
ncbi:MAG TPA: hypothetical protein DCX54_10890 [Flavobacteriales bacterium]|nr:hypothetical protein [Flavobacteriales bacterium]